MCHKGAWGTRGAGLRRAWERGVCPVRRALNVVQLKAGLRASSHSRVPIQFVYLIYQIEMTPPNLRPGQWKAVYAEYKTFTIVSAAKYKITKVIRAAMPGMRALIQSVRDDPSAKAQVVGLYLGKPGSSTTRCYLFPRNRSNGR